MENDSNLFANIEERKEPLLVPPLNLDNLNENEPLRLDGEIVTFRGETTPDLHISPDKGIELGPVDGKTFDQNQIEAINGLKGYHFTPDPKKWHHKIFLRKHFNALANPSDLSKDLEIDERDLQDIAFGDS